jgi:Amt family ammonium transporter
MAIKILLILLIVAPLSLLSQEKNHIETLQYNIDIMWTLISAILVFFMQAGFAMLEAGLTRAKNVVNIMMKNLMDFSIGTLIFFIIGFGLMFGTNSTGLIGTDGFFLSDYSKDGGEWTLVFWMFQVVFAATAATIVSGSLQLFIPYSEAGHGVVCIKDRAG